MRLCLLFIFALLTLCSCKRQYHLLTETSSMYENGGLKNYGTDRVLKLSDNKEERLNVSIAVDLSDETLDYISDTNNVKLLCYIVKVEQCNDLCTIHLHQTRSGSKNDKDMIIAGDEMTYVKGLDIIGSTSIHSESIGWIEFDLGIDPLSGPIVYTLTLQGYGLVKLSSRRIAVYHE